MGVTIEQYYRARIGARNNVRIEVDSTQLEGNFCDAMLNVDVISVGNNNYYINQKYVYATTPRSSLCYLCMQNEKTIKLKCANYYSGMRFLYKKRT